MKLHRQKHKRAGEWAGYTYIKGDAVRLTKFEKIVEQLGLKPDQYADSVELKEWVTENMNDLYVPEDLLDVWHLVPDVGFDGPTYKYKAAILEHFQNAIN